MKKRKEVLIWGEEFEEGDVIMIDIDIFTYTAIIECSEEHCYLVMQDLDDFDCNFLEDILEFEDVSSYDISEMQILSNIFDESKLDL